MVNNHQVQLMRRPDRALGCGPAPASTKEFQQKKRNLDCVLEKMTINCNHVLLCFTLESQSASCVPQTVKEAEFVLLTERLIPLQRAQSARAQFELFMTRRAS